MAAAVGGVLLLVLRGGSSSSSTPARSPLAATYTALSDRTLRSCAPDHTPLGTFDSCVARYRNGLDQLTLPSADASTLEMMRDIVGLLQACRSSQLHEDVTMREWPAACPQQGPATIAAADAMDQRFRAQYYAMLIVDDNTIRASLGEVTVAPPSAAP